MNIHQRRAAAWLAASGTFVIVNGIILNHRHDGSTFSECTRLVYRTDTRLGRWAFLSSFAVFVSWFPLHILGGETK